MQLIKLQEAWLTLPELPSSDVHLFYTSLKQPSAYLESLRKILSSDELAKAERFYFEKDRTSYIAARGMLRKILSHYLAIEPSTIQFQYSPYGKPSVPQAIHFNVSHSHERVLYAISQKRVVGIDIEFIRPVQEFWEVAKTYFSKNEVAMLAKIPPQKQLEAFYQLWTRKEAYIKAKGGGLSMPLSSFDVSLGEPTRLLETRPDKVEALNWILKSYIPEEHYIAALVMSTKQYRS